MDATAPFQALIDRYLAAYAAQDAEGCAAFYAPDGEVYSPYGPPARGRDEIVAEHLRWFEAGETDKTMRVIHARAEDDLGYCFVVFEADVPGVDGKPERMRGTSLNAMERRSDGLWTIKLTSLNELQELGTEHIR